MNLSARGPLSTYKVQMKRYIVVILPFLMMLVFYACESNAEKSDPIPSISINDDGSINAYIEIPAGNNVKYEFDEADQQLKPDQIDGKDRVIDFLPYPGNYGFIAGTQMDADKGGDGDALDVLVLCDTRPFGTAMKVLPIGIILLEDQGKADHKIIAVPFEAAKRTINVEKFSSFITKYNSVQFIVQEWFMNYKGLGKMKLLGWKDEAHALKEIRKWSKKRNN